MGWARVRSEQEIFTLPPRASAHEAAQALASRNIGAVVVAGPDGKPLGIVTDRDIVTRVVAAGLDAREVALEKVMTSKLVTTLEGADHPADIAVLMSERGIRRVPIVAADGRVTGIVTFDDLISLYGHGMSCLSHAVARQRTAKQG
jgi:signal-transduction protein with cAMP-binding, CBS, and nucleotidyltransferase domain